MHKGFLILSQNLLCLSHITLSISLCKITVWRTLATYIILSKRKKKSSLCYSKEKKRLLWKNCTYTYNYKQGLTTKNKPQKKHWKSIHYNFYFLLIITQSITKFTQHIFIPKKVNTNFYFYFRKNIKPFSSRPL